MKLTKKCIFAIASFVILVLQAFGIKVDVPVVNEIIAAAASVLVMLGIVTDGTTKKSDGTDGEPSDAPSSDPDAAYPEDEQGQEEEQDKPADSEQDGEETEGDKQPDEHSGEDIDEDIIE